MNIHLFDSGLSQGFVGDFPICDLETLLSLPTYFTISVYDSATDLVWLLCAAVQSIISQGTSLLCGFLKIRKSKMIPLNGICETHQLFMTGNKGIYDSELKTYEKLLRLGYLSYIAVKTGEKINHLLV